MTRRSLRIAVFQHHPAEGPGRLAQWAGERGHALTVFLCKCPESLDDFDAVVLLGGPYSVNNVPPWLQGEMRCIEHVVARRTPILGICLGAQILAKALGASVRALPQPEYGWTTVRFTDGAELDVLQWHDEQCDLPPWTARPAGSAACTVQAFRAPNRCIGMQFHPEWNDESVGELNRAFGDESPLPREHDAVRHRRVRDWFFDVLDGWLENASENEAGVRNA
jgi:GMP synthase-like glutamine amidotransferase